MSRRILSSIALSAVTALIVLSAGSAAANEHDLTQLDLSTLMDMDVTLVTAQKRTENVNAVPISISVLKRDRLGRDALDSTADLQTVVPGLTTTNFVGFMLPYIRGVGTDNVTSIEPSVSIYVDDVFQVERSQTFVDLADIEQIEVLRGPQGTLYGRNTTAGAIKITTRGPTDHWVGDARVTSGNYDLRDASVFVAGPLNERTRISLAGHARDRDSYYRDLQGDRIPDGETFYALNGRIQLDLTSDLSAELSLKYFSRDDTVSASNEVNTNSAAALLGIPVSTEPFVSASDQLDAPNRLITQTAALKLDWNTPWTRVRSTTAYTHLHHRSAYDLDATAAPLIYITQDAPSRTLTQELQFSPAQSATRVDWLAGVFYMDSSVGFDPLLIAAEDIGVGTIRQVVHSDAQTQAYAAFGEATWRFDHGFAVTGGLRYSNETKRLVDTSYELTGMPLVRFADRAKNWDDVNYRLIASHTTARTMVYAKTETGFKSGAYNNYNPVHPGPIGPETITAYELGLKHSLHSAPVHVSLAAFYNDIEDLQLQALDANSLSQVFIQAPHATAYGIDTQIDWKPSERWTIGAGLAWLEAEFDTFYADGIVVRSLVAGNEVANGVNLEGNRLPRSPRLTGNLNVSFAYPLGPGSLIGAANFYSSSRVYFGAANEYGQGAFEVLNASVEYRSAAGWSVSGWVKNLADATYLSSVFPTPMSTIGRYAEPRTYGVSVGYAFGR